MNKTVVEQCYQKSIDLLLKNSTKFGVLASSPSVIAEKRNYLSIFGRDAAICSLGMVLSQDKKLIYFAKQSLITLARAQSRVGQIPFYTKPEKKQTSHWYTISVDSNLWWLMAIKFYDNYSGEKEKLEKKLAPQIKMAINWVECRENPGFFLLEQNEAGDWADYMPRSGYVLYSNALWCKVKELYKLPNRKETNINFNYLFDPSNQEIPESKLSRIIRVKNYLPKKKKFDNYLSFVNFSFFGSDVDIYGNLLAFIFGPGNPAQLKNFIKYSYKNKINLPLSVKAVINPIRENSKLWNEKMRIHNQDLPDKYHNGGIWPFIGAFWVMALKDAGKDKEAQEELIKLAETNKHGNWGFYEWFHGQTGKAMGKRGQSWNAAMFILAFNHLKNIKIR